MHLADTLRASAARTPDAVAVRLGGRSLTYAELDGAVDAATCVLQDAGVGAGDRVAVMLGNRIDFVVAWFAALRAGGVVVPVNTSLTASEVAHELADSRAAAMVVGRAHVPVVEQLRGTLPDLASPFVAESSEADPGPDLTSWSAALHAAAGRTPAAVALDEYSLAVLAYTSGTTGSPKGAMLTHGQLLANQRQVQASGAGVVPGDVVMTPLPLFHIYGLNVALGPTIANGGTLELLERFDPAASLAVIAERRVTVVVGAPPMYATWLRTPGAAGADLSSVRLATSGAAALPATVLSRCRDELGLDVREGYGLTEAGPVVTSSAALDAAVPGSVGRPLDDVEVRIVDDGRAAEDGDPGVVHVRGPNVFSGYWERPDETAAVLDDDGWLDTGDIGYLADGLLHLVDRARDLVIVSGFNVYPVEVEAALGSHPAVAQAAVVGVPHPHTGEAVRAFVVVEPGAEVTADELIAHSATRLARFKQPESVVFVDELPMLPTGKLRRRFLRDDAATGTAAAPRP